MPSPLISDGICRGCKIPYEGTISFGIMHQRKCRHVRIWAAMVQEGVDPQLAADLAMQANPPAGGLNELRRQLRSKAEVLNG